MTRHGRNRGLAWAFAVSAALHLLVAGSAVKWPHLLHPAAPPVVPEQAASVEVVMGASAESSGAESAPPIPDPATPDPPKPDPTPAAPPAPPPPPAPLDAPAPPPAAPPASAASPAPRPAPPSWEANPLPEGGVVGAAEIIGDQLKPARPGHGNIPPGYPALSARLGEQGTVLLRMHIAADGGVDSVVVLETSGYPRLDGAARAALAKWRFTPAMENGQPVDSWQDLPVHFKMN
jgi:protein TonB